MYFLLKIIPLKIKNSLYCLLYRLLVRCRLRQHEIPSSIPGSGSSNIVFSQFSNKQHLAQDWISVRFTIALKTYYIVGLNIFGLSWVHYLYLLFRRENTFFKFSLVYLFIYDIHHNTKKNKQ